MRITIQGACFFESDGKGTVYGYSLKSKPLVFALPGCIRDKLTKYCESQIGGLGGDETDIRKRFHAIGDPT
jgi:hypothetical protein